MNREYSQIEGRLLELLARPAELSESLFNETALSIYQFQRRHNPAFESYCKLLGAGMELESWKAIPAVPQSAFKHSALRAFPAELTSTTFRTSGTTGEGFGEHHFLSTRLYDAAILHGWDYFGLPKLRQAILTLPPEHAPHSSLSHMMGCLKARAPHGSQQFLIRADGTLDLPGLQQAAAQSEPLLLMGTALAFLHLFESQPRLELPPGSFALETGGYKGDRRVLTKPELYAMFSAQLGLAPDRVFNEYGMTELSSQFYAQGLGSPHLAPPWMRAVLIDPETGLEAAPGATGMIRILDLANLGSVLAIQTRDLAISSPSQTSPLSRPDAQAGFELLGRDPAALPRGCSRSADEILSAGAN